MQIGYTANIGNYQSIKYTSSEFNKDDDLTNLLNCNKEILFAMEKHYQNIKELEDNINLFRKIVRDLEFQI